MGDRIDKNLIARARCNESGAKEELIAKALALQAVNDDLSKPKVEVPKKPKRMHKPKKK